MNLGWLNNGDAPYGPIELSDIVLVGLEIIVVEVEDTMSVIVVVVRETLVKILSDVLVLVEVTVVLSITIWVFISLVVEVDVLVAVDCTGGCISAAQADEIAPGG